MEPYLSKTWERIMPTSDVILEMLEPNEEFSSRLEWIADWLDKTDQILRDLELSENMYFKGVSNYLYDDLVQRDLRRWAEELRNGL